MGIKTTLSGRGFADKQVIRPALASRVLAKLMEVNPLYQNIQIDLSWENVSQGSDLELQNIITEENHKHVEGETDDDDDDDDEHIEGNNHI